MSKENKNGFEKVKAKQIFSPKAIRFLLKSYCHCRLSEDEELTPQMLRVIEIYSEDVLSFLKDLATPVRFKGCSGYSYTFNPENPFEVRASDGGAVNLKFISDLDEYAGYEGEFIEAICEGLKDLFDTGYVDQENHELEMLGGKPQKSITCFWD